MRFLLRIGFLLLVPASALSADLRVMTYNVENLFDAVDDPGKDDGTYLPLARKDAAHKKKCRKIRNAQWRRQCLEWDWTEKIVAEKIRRLKGVIQHRWKDGPDILLLQEVENDAVLARLQKALGYPRRVLLEGADLRGIDTAVLTRLPQAAPPRLEKVVFPKRFAKRKGDTRPLLVVPLKTPHGVLTVIPVHFPAPFHPIEMRISAFETLNRVAEEEIRKGRSVLAGGDFNVPGEEDTRLYRGMAAPHWSVSHLIGCHACPGTNYYAPKKSWSFLDAILIHRKNPSWRAVGESVERITEAPHQTDNGRPREFDLRNGKVSGLSDHYPITLVLKGKNPGDG